MKIIRIATRSSPLALWQANFVRSKLLEFHPHLTIELYPLTTSGDKFLNVALKTLGGKGLFVKELEEALLDKRADLAVHSMKDVPVTLPEGLSISCLCQRDNPLDAMLSLRYDSLKSLPDNAKIGTSSLRRKVQLLAYNPSFNIVPIRGNIHTRMEKLAELDAIILAAAGLERMNIQARAIITEEIMLPACSQGVLGIECRAIDAEMQELLLPLHHHETAVCVRAERAVNALLGGSCHTPLAVFAKIMNNNLTLKASLGSIDGKIILTAEAMNALHHAIHTPKNLSIADDLAQNCAQSLLAQGGKKLLEY
jgi:hydroxymethylbilane synthase